MLPWQLTEITFVKNKTDKIKLNNIKNRQMHIKLKFEIKTEKIKINAN